MKKPNPRKTDPSLFHILMGKPDEDCEICRAHGLTGHDLPDGASRIMIVDMAPLDEILRCSCPLCSQIQFEPFEEPGAGDDPGELREE
jgi:hypothetical protein